MLCHKMLTIIHQRQDNLFNTQLRCDSNDQMDVIRYNAGLIECEALTVCHVQPVADQRRARRGLKDSVSELSRQNYMMA